MASLVWIKNDADVPVVALERPNPYAIEVGYSAAPDDTISPKYSLNGVNYRVITSEKGRTKEEKNDICREIR